MMYSGTESTTNKEGATVFEVQVREEEEGRRRGEGRGEEEKGERREEGEERGRREGRGGEGGEKRGKEARG